MTGPVTASGRDLRALARIIRADRGEPPAQGVAPSLLSDLLALVRCDHLLFTGSDSSRQVSWVAQLAPAEVGDWFDPAAAGNTTGAAPPATPTAAATCAASSRSRISTRPGNGTARASTTTLAGCTGSSTS